MFVTFIVYFVLCTLSGRQTAYVNVCDIYCVFVFLVLSGRRTGCVNVENCLIFQIYIRFPMQKLSLCFSFDSQFLVYFDVTVIPNFNLGYLIVVKTY